MVELIRLHRFDKTELIHTSCCVRHHFGNPRPAFAVLSKFLLVPEHPWRAVDERETLAFQK